MISQKFRPRVFSEVVGHPTVIKTLKCIVRNPDVSPKIIILQGEFGTGKTTCARILARALNCKHRKSDGDACGECENCKMNIDDSLFYTEYDAATVGNVESIRNLRDTFYFNSDYGYKVIVLDEFHLLSGAAMSALLKVFEELTGNVFVVLCTTHIDKILPTIRSRSLELRFNLVPEEQIIDNVKYIVSENNLDIDDETAKMIARRSFGHMRNAHMLIDQYLLLGDDFKKSVSSSREMMLSIMVLAVTDKVDDNTKLKMLAERVKVLQGFSLASVKTDYEALIEEFIKTSIKVMVPQDVIMKSFVDSVGPIYNLVTIELLNILKLDMFNSDKQLQISAYLLFDKLREVINR